MGRQAHNRSISVAKAVSASIMRSSNFQGIGGGGSRAHTSLCLDDDFQGRACDAPRLDFSIPRTLDGDTCEQDDHERGRADDCEESDEDVCVLVEFLMCGRYET